MRSVGKFYDDKNFPRGFNRSGVFTIGEAQILENFGRTMRGLADGSLIPETVNEQEFLADISGSREIQTSYAKCWSKYVNKTTNKVRSYTLCVSQRKQHTHDFDDDDVETDIDI
ncbi:DUF413 domain-containing protein [Photobacterium lutimaris]|uniref:Macrodomain Ori protein n=1 Tax=Photobacterium lutimaris TaxID=388278 RepID=A0A2T3J387_9GAMM|nr:DUF413 domain-containing protein [Photobacterium lutimaris]PSU35750.1 hypothetical protein C9I99_01665 [Photobacterium lutimaris]TDR78817.1 hypothetical protein DFP78_101330 [Photobacterium lutimaris]